MPAPLNYAEFSQKYTCRIDLPIGESYINFGGYRYTLKVAAPAPGSYKKECEVGIKLNFIQTLVTMFLYPLGFSTWHKQKCTVMVAELRKLYKDNLEETMLNAQHIIAAGGCNLTIQNWLKERRENDPASIKTIPFGRDFEETGILTPDDYPIPGIAAQDIIKPSGATQDFIDRNKPIVEKLAQLPLTIKFQKAAQKVILI